MQELKIEIEQIESQEVPRIAWVEVQKALNFIYDRNPKQHDLDGICESIKKYGWQELPKYDVQLGAIKAGNGRVAALAQMENSGESRPRGIAKHKESGAWIVPILCGIDAASDIEAKSYLIDSNNLTLMGGDFTALDITRAYDNSYLDILEELAEQNALPISVDGNDLEFLISQFHLQSENLNNETKEINAENFEGKHRCPRCGFEWDE